MSAPNQNKYIRKIMPIQDKTGVLQSMNIHDMAKIYNFDDLFETDQEAEFVWGEVVNWGWIDDEGPIPW